MIEDLIRILDDITENYPFDKSQDYLTNSKKMSPEQAMNLMLKEPTVFLSPVVFIMFTTDVNLDITLKDYAYIIMKQATVFVNIVVAFSYFSILINPSI